MTTSFIQRASAVTAAPMTKLNLRVFYANGSSDLKTIYVNGPEDTWPTQIMLRLRALVHRYDHYEILHKEPVTTKWHMPVAAVGSLKRLKAYAAALEQVDSEEDVAELIKSLEDLRTVCEDTIRHLKP